MNPYLSIIAARFRTHLQYRGAAFGGMATQTFFGLVRIMILEAFYRSTTQPQPMSFGEVVGYIWLGQATFAMQPWNVDNDVRQMVRTGTVAYELVRPVDWYSLWYTRALAWRASPLVMRAIPMFIIAMIVLPLIGMSEWSLRPPPSVASGVAFLVVLFGALLLSTAITTLMNISVLWTISGDGIATLSAGFVILLSGMVMPLPLFPDWAQPMLRALPFAGLMDFPGRVYTGNIAPADAVWVIVHQLIWTAALIGFGRWILSRGARRLVVQGG